jgi:oligopeptide transport system permease protein
MIMDLNLITGSRPLIFDDETPLDENDKNFTPPLDFSRAEKLNQSQQLSRPSLSYWEDAWLRIKKNKPALFSLALVSLLIIFVTVGPWIWRVDSAFQNSSLISTSPSLGTSALVVDDVEPWEGITEKKVLETPLTNIENLSAPKDFKTLDIPNTHSVRLQWRAVTGASGYSLYRNEILPTAENLGLPLGDVAGGNHTSFEDASTLQVKNYYYTLKAKNLNGDESANLAVLKVGIIRALTLSEASLLNSEVKVGEKVKIPATPLGTDALGRDMLARLMSGGRVSLFIGFFAAFLYVLLGVLIGGIAGYAGGRTDAWILRGIDFVSGLPFLLFMILLKVVLSVGPGESGIFALMVALIILSWVGTARLVRGQIFQLRESEFVQASRLMGAKSNYILLRHLIPNLLGIIIVSLTFEIPTSIFTEAFLSFIGLGVASPATSWGAMCTDGLSTLLTQPHEFFLPAAFITITVLAFNILGDGLRDALDPRMRAGR